MDELVVWDEQNDIHRREGVYLCLPVVNGFELKNLACLM
jgi:hypothetical protein